MSSRDAVLHQRHWPNGQVKEEWSELNGVREGFRRFYLESGRLFAEWSFAMEKGTALSVELREDGSLMLEATLKDGEFHGYYRSYWKNGLVKEEGVYENGKALKGYRWYQDDGTLWKEKTSDPIPGEDLPAFSAKDVE